jgi:hypothetical protein
MGDQFTVSGNVGVQPGAITTQSLSKKLLFGRTPKPILMKFGSDTGIDVNQHISKEETDSTDIRWCIALGV